MTTSMLYIIQLPPTSTSQYGDFVAYFVRFRVNRPKKGLTAIKVVAMTGGASQVNINPQSGAQSTVIGAVATAILANHPGLQGRWRMVLQTP
jgi:hypothetical protein